MSDTNYFHGIIPPMVTLFNDQGEIDWDGNGKLIDFLIDHGVHGIMVQGSLGEFAHLTFEERKSFAKFTIEKVNKRVPVIVGTGTTYIEDTVSLSNFAMENGADAVMIVNPYYWVLSEENLYQYYASIANRVQGPILLYNIPSLTGQLIPVSVIKRLADEIENIVGIKETVDSIGHIRDVLLEVKSKHPRFSVLAAYDDHIFPALAMGADGAICGSSNYIPQASVNLYESFKEENFKESIKYHQNLLPFVKLFTIETPPIGIMKEAVKQVLGNVSNYVRIPGASVKEENKLFVQNLLKNFNR